MLAMIITLRIDALERIHLEIRFVQPVRVGQDLSAGGDLRDGTVPPSATCGCATATART
jgi:hypothetical protein